jgi:alpha-L-fucosidase
MKRRELIEKMAGFASGLAFIKTINLRDQFLYEESIENDSCFNIIPDHNRIIQKAEFKIPSDDHRLKMWRDARFGMFIHWGLFSMEGTGDGYISPEEYERRRLSFSAPAFDADAWAQLAVDAGMHYLVLICRHVDGFCLWPSEFSKFTVANTPLGVDVVKKVADACRRRGLLFGTYLAIPDFFHPDWPQGITMDGSKKKDPRMDRFVIYLKNQVKELIDGYNPALIWFDGDNEAPWTHEYGLDLYRWCRSLDRNILINNRVDKGRQGLKIGDGKKPEDFNGQVGFDMNLFTYFRTPRPPGEYAGDYATPEQTIGSFDRTNPWETCMTLGQNWTWKSGEALKTTEELIGILASCAGGDGNFLLNTGPRGDGSIDPEQAARMLGIGKWLSVNGNVIYGSRGGPWKPGKYGVSTCSGSQVNLIILDKTLSEISLPALPVGITDCRINGIPSIYRISNNIFNLPLPPAQENEPARIVELKIGGNIVNIEPILVS